MSALEDLLKSRGLGVGSGIESGAALTSSSKAAPQTHAFSNGIIVHDCTQGTPEWTRLRSGIPTASQFDKILTPGGKLSSQQEKYMFGLLAERIMGHPIIEFMSRWMDRGTQLEADAVAFYELQRELATVKVGFITNSEGTIGASPDRLVGEYGLLEIKVPSESVHMSYLMRTGSAYQEYRVQVQGQLWISQRQWSDVLSFHPELPPALIRIDRDEPFITMLSQGVEQFSWKLEELSREAIAKGWLREDWRKEMVQL